MIADIISAWKEYQYSIIHTSGKGLHDLAWIPLQLVMRGTRQSELTQPFLHKYITGYILIHT